VGLEINEEMTKITISGTPGSGKSVIAEKLCKEFNLKYYDLGKLMRKAAESRNISLEELREVRKKDDSIDKDLDNEMKRIGIEEDDFVFVGRVAYHFIPDSIKLYFKCTIEEGAKRILGHNDESRKVESFSNIQEAIDKLIARQKVDEHLYFDLYGLNPFDESNYDLVIDTTNLNVEEVFAKVLEFIKNN